MNEKKSQKVVVASRVDPWLADRMQEIADERGFTRSELVGAAMLALVIADNATKEKNDE